MAKNRNDYPKASFGSKLRGGRLSIAKKVEDAVKISFLGGLNEVGKNMTVFEYEDSIIILDCGLSFPDADLPGVDLVIPDFTYVQRNKDKIKGIVITHGHEDHIGALPYLLKSINAPIYATKLTVGLIQGKLKEHKIDNAHLNIIKPHDSISLGSFTVEAIHVNHSIPDAIAVAIRCHAGIIVHTGDFKIDTTPIDGDMIDMARFAELGREGVLCLMADSTNAERPGYTESEKKVGETFDSLFRRAGDRRIIVATFASNIHRVQQIIDSSRDLGRKVALSGRSLENVVKIGIELGYINIPDDVLISIDEIKRYTDDRITIITTGSQGEPMSALTRMSSGDHRKVQISANDMVIISATPIPGNEKTVGRVIDELLKLGAEVVYNKMYDVHVSGHARQEELKMMMGCVKPKYFIPVHGEQKHLRCHAAIAHSLGLDERDIILADNGCSISVSEDSARIDSTVPAGRVFVDGYGIGDVGNMVLKDRKRLSEDGLVVVGLAIDVVTGELMTSPAIESKGFVYVKEAEELYAEARELVEDIALRCLDDHIDIQLLKNRIKDELARLMYERTKRNPIILPVILDV